MCKSKGKHQVPERQRVVLHGNPPIEQDNGKLTKQYNKAIKRIAKHIAKGKKL